MTYDPYRIIQLEALRDYLLKTNAFFERKVRRWYSTTFHTPLKDVYDLDWEFVLKNYYESIMETNGYNNTIDFATDLLPELAQLEEEENQKFADSLKEEQEETLRKKAIRDKKRAEKKAKIEVMKKQPGYIGENASDLEYMRKREEYEKKLSNSIDNKDKKQSLNKNDIESDNDGKPNIPSINMTFDDDI